MANRYQVNPFLITTEDAPIREAASWAAEYDGSHGPILRLSQGVPAAPPNEHFLWELGKQAADPENTKYGELYGEHELRESLTSDINATYRCQQSVSIDNVAITAGCNMAAQIILQTIARSGDEIIVPVPCYFNHSMCLDMLGIGLRKLPCAYDLPRGGFVPSVQEAAGLINSGTKAILLVSPNNPTGSIYTPELLQEFYELCRDNNIALILDETYRDFLPVYETGPHGLFANEDWQSTLISLYSFSKSYAIPGHRCGAIVCSKELMQRQISKILDTMIICAPRAAQRTLAWAVTNEHQMTWRREHAQELAGKRELFVQVINAVNARLAQNERPVSWEVQGLGGYYAFLKHPYSSRGLSCVDVGRLLASKVGTICLPGTFFSQEHSEHLRISVSNVGRDGIVALEERLVALDGMFNQ